MPLGCGENEALPSLQVAVSPTSIGGTPTVQPQEPTVWCAQVPLSSAGADDERVVAGAEAGVFVGGACAEGLVVTAEVFAG